MKTRPEDEVSEQNQEDTPDIDVCAQDLIDAVHSKDVKRTSDALKAAFTILESAPHDEYEEGQD